MLPVRFLEDRGDLCGFQAMMHMRLDVADLTRGEVHVGWHDGAANGFASGQECREMAG